MPKKQDLSSEQISLLSDFTALTGLSVIRQAEFEAGDIDWQELWGSNYDSFYSIQCSVASLNSKASNL